MGQVWQLVNIVYHVLFISEHYSENWTSES